MEITPKLVKTIEEDDRISLLPDWLLIDIISRLPETNKWIRIGTLLKQWQHLWPYLWPYVHNLFGQCRHVMCFIRLRLKGCELNPDGAISWRNLKSFFISYAKLDEVLIQNILSGSPVLETLELDHCCGFRRVDITSKSVEKFVFPGYNGDTDHVIEINAPYFVSLTIGGGLILSKLLLPNVSSLVKAELHYAKGGHAETTREEAEEEILKGLLVNLSHVKELQISVLCQKGSF